MEIKELEEKLKSKFKRIWRCSDSNKWDILKNSDLLTFDWIDKNINYKSLSADNIGAGKRAIYPFVNSLKIGDLIFIMGKNSFQGIAICESEYQFNGLILNMGLTGNKPAIKVKYLFKSENSVNHNLETHNNPTTFANIDQYNFGLANVLKFLKTSLPEAYVTLINNVNYTKMNYKEQYITWLNSTNKERSNKADSYLKALEYLSLITKIEIFEEDNLSKLNFLYNDLLKEQKNQKVGGKYFYAPAPAYGKNGFFSAAIKSYSDFIAQLPKTQISKTSLITNMPLNSILYGPPGTGKTFNSIDKAVAIVTGSSSDHISNKKQFDELRKQGLIEFVTFHQNYSYEDFMVGIRPNVSETTSELSFKKHYGIFYEVAKRARENYLSSLSNTRKFENSIMVIKQIVDKSGEYEIKMKTSFFYITQIDNKNIIGHNQTGKIYNFSISEVLSDAKKYTDNLESLITARQSKAEWGYLVEELIKLSGDSIVMKNFVLIIDEINRANISKVFGELITLLEDDKRLGKPNELKITLPNGEKEFGVPPNLYLIGTMNTADKSIALIDIALRRRFEFIGYYPDYENEKLKSEAKTLLQKINEEIYKLKNSADYLIGHAYFMKDEAIETTLRNKVIPLLMEYFSGKTKIVSDIFNETTWKVEYDTTQFNWTISLR